MDIDQERFVYPKEHVLKLMKDSDKRQRQKAKDYYYEHYATEEEKHKMDKVDSIKGLLTALLFIFITIFFLFVYVPLRVSFW